MAMQQEIKEDMALQQEIQESPIKLFQNYTSFMKIWDLDPLQVEASGGILDVTTEIRSRLYEERRSQWEVRNQRIESLRKISSTPNSQPAVKDEGTSNSSSMGHELYWGAIKKDVDDFIDVLEEQVSTEKELSLTSIIDGVNALGNTLLHEAVMSHGDEDTVKLIAYHFPSLLPKKNSKGDTALHIAAKSGNDSVVQILLTLTGYYLFPGMEKDVLSSDLGLGNDLLPRIANDEGNTALHDALINRHQRVAGCLSWADSEVLYYVNKEDKSAVYLAAEAGYVDCVKDLKGDAYEKLKGKSPIHAAVMGRNQGVLDILLKKEPRFIHLRDEEGRTPLHCAASIGYLEGVCYLLDKYSLGAMKKDKNGCFPIHVASINGHVDVIEKLLQHCPHPSWELLNNNGQNIFHVAAKSGKHDVVDFILKRPELEVLINQSDKDGNTPLHLAAMNWHPFLASYIMVDKRVDLKLKNKKGETALGVEYYLKRMPSFEQREIQRKIEREIPRKIDWEAVFKQLPSQKSVPRNDSSEVQSSLEIWQLYDRLDGDIEIQIRSQWESRNQMIESLRKNSIPNSQPGVPNQNLDHGQSTLSIEESSQISLEEEDEGTGKYMGNDLYWAAKKDDVDNFINVLVRVVSIEKKLSLPAVLNSVCPYGNTLLHLALSSGHDDTVRLIAYHFRSLLTKKNSKGDTALHIAAKSGNKLVVWFLLEIQRNMLPRIANNRLSRIENDEENTALHDALIYGHQSVAEFLSKEDPEVLYYVNEEDKSALYLAAEAGYKDCLENVNGDAYGKIRGKSPIHAAVVGRNKGVLDILLTKEPRFIQLRDEEERTPLHCAASIGDLDGVCYLLEKYTLGAIKKDKYGFFPIHLASMNGHVDVIQKLLSEEYCTDPRELLNHYNQNIFHVAAESGKHNVVRYILKCLELEKLINERDKDGNTPLHLATMNWYPKIVNDLTWDKRVDLKLMNNDGRTALDAAEYNYKEGMASSLLRGLTWAALSAAGAPRAPLDKIHITNRPAAKPLEPPNMKNYKDRVNTLLLVSTLVATVTFAAGFTMPGGYSNSNPDLGMATMLRRKLFPMFVFCDTIAMYSSIIVAVTLIWAQLGDLNLVLAALKLALPLLGIALAMMSLAFMAGVYLVVSKLKWLAIAVLVMGLVFTVILSALFFPLRFSYTSSNQILRYIMYYPLCLLIWATDSDSN